MTRMTRTAMAGALAAAVALGVSAPAATAAPKASHVKTDHRAAKAHKHDKVDRSLTAAQRRLAKQAARKDAYLGRLERSNKVERLEDTAEAAVLANIAEDRTQLGDLKAPAATSDVKELRTEIRGFRPEVYHTIINQLRLATRMQKNIAASAEAATLTAQTDQLTALLALLATYDAETARADLRAAQKVLSSVQEAVESADDADDESDTETDTPETETPEGDTTTTPAP